MKEKKKKGFWRTIKKDGALHLMIAIPVIMLFVFHYISLAGIIIAFQDYKPAKGFFQSEFVGLENFRTLFYTPGFLVSLRNTVIIACGKIVLGIVVPVTIALLLNEMKKNGIKRVIQTLIYLPHFVSWVLLAGIIIEILNPRDGLLNQFLGIFGVEPIYFLGDADLFRPILWITDIWKEFGYSTIIYLAALAGVDTALYEAAALDGAGHMQKVWHVTLPGIAPTIVLMMTLKLGSVLDAGFEQVYNLYSAVTMETGDIIDTLVYRLGIGGGQFSIAATAGLFKSVIASVLIVVSYKLAYKFSGYRVF
ncbi:MAG: sugar ABC transporter permease [Lachnospiraceae bacterium]|nr:sugar ABC transporter permease [Lachnospiraceae bacterium]